MHSAFIFFHVYDSVFGSYPFLFLIFVHFFWMFIHLDVGDFVAIVYSQAVALVNSSPFSTQKNFFSPVASLDELFLSYTFKINIF